MSYLFTLERSYLLSSHKCLLCEEFHPNVYLDNEARLLSTHKTKTKRTSGLINIMPRLFDAPNHKDWDHYSLMLSTISMDTADSQTKLRRAELKFSRYYALFQIYILSFIVKRH